MQHILDQTSDAYRQMATDAHYRPAAPSDGHGNITVPIEDLDLDKEAMRYAHRWWTEEDQQDYRIGCPDFSDRPALIFTIEAARAICGVNRELAINLLELALTDLKARS